VMGIGEIDTVDMTVPRVQRRPRGLSCLRLRLSPEPYLGHDRFVETGIDLINDLRFQVGKFLRPDRAVSDNVQRSLPNTLYVCMLGNLSPNAIAPYMRSHSQDQTLAEPGGIDKSCE